MSTAMMLAMMQREILALAESLMRERCAGDAELRRFEAAFSTAITAETAKYGDQAQETIQTIQRYPLTALETYILMHRLRRETVLLIGTALVNSGWTLEDARGIEQSLNEILGE